MNERIRQLAEQARQYAIEKIENSQDPTEWSTAMFEQKFAELIVKECAELVKDGVIEQQVRDRNTYTYTSVSAADTILEHFGVE